MKQSIRATWTFEPLFIQGRLRFHIVPRMCTDTAFELSHQSVKDIQKFLTLRHDEEADRLDGLALRYGRALRYAI